MVGRTCLVNDPKTTLLRFGSITTLDAFDEGELLLPKINLNLIQKPEYGHAGMDQREEVILV